MQEEFYDYDPIVDELKKTKYLSCREKEITLVTIPYWWDQSKSAFIQMIKVMGLKYYLILQKRMPRLFTEVEEIPFSKFPYKGQSVNSIGTFFVPRK